MHIAKVRESVNKVLKQYKHNAVPIVDHFEYSTYYDGVEGLGINYDPNMVVGLFIVLSEDTKKYCFFWSKTGEIYCLGEIECSVFDNVACFAAMTNSYVWLLDLLFWDSKDFRKENLDFRFQCLVRFTTNATMPGTYTLHLPVQVKKTNKELYPTLVEHYKMLMVFHKESFKY